MKTHKRKYEYFKKYREANREKYLMASKKFAKNNTKKVVDWVKKWRIKNPEKANHYSRECARRRRLECLYHYGGKVPRCVCCGENEINFLVLDHKNNDGAKHRKLVGTGTSMFLWVKRNNFPNMFQVLCHNCNMAKGFYGICPHKKR
ncbi:MAG: hypothetical protein AAB875_06755 [Patescibacteria group bacterium]